jgi:hypothetical protein
MRTRYGLVFAFIALSACNQQAGPIEVEGKDEAEAAPAVQPMVPGFYAIKSEDTVYSRTRLAEDGSYTDYDAGDNAVGGGSWTSDGATICFDPAGDGENQQESCWINDAPGEDGSFVTRLVDGDVSYVVTPLGE